MSHLLYLMFRCDFDVMESLESLGNLNIPLHVKFYPLFHFAMSVSVCHASLRCAWAAPVYEKIESWR